MDWYRWLLALYPASFRREYGAEMRADFARRLRAASGTRAPLVWIDAILDALRNAWGPRTGGVFGYGIRASLIRTLPLALHAATSLESTT